MGFLDTLIRTANYVTGGAAEVFVSVEEIWHDGRRPIKPSVGCQVNSLDCEIQHVALNIKAIERVSVEDVEKMKEKEGRISVYKEDVEQVLLTHAKDGILVSGAQTLKAGQRYQWETELKLPQDVNGTYRGRNANHDWLIQAELETSGANPQSEWKVFFVRM